VVKSKLIVYSNLSSFYFCIYYYYYYLLLRFEDLYESYEREGRARRVIKAKELWTAIINSQIETGTPYMVYKDACNLKSNQQNLGVIKSSNLCTGMFFF